MEGKHQAFQGKGGGGPKNPHKRRQIEEQAGIHPAQITVAIGALGIEHHRKLSRQQAVLRPLDTDQMITDVIPVGKITHKIRVHGEHCQRRKKHHDQR